MSRWNEAYEDRREREREERRQYERDVSYDVWRSGRDPERISDDRVERHFEAGDSAESAARHEIRIQQQAAQAREDERHEAERQEYERYTAYQAERAAQEPEHHPSSTTDQPPENVPF